MEFTISCLQLAQALRIVKKAFPQRRISVEDIFHFVLIQATEAGTLAITATNAQVWATVTVTESVQVATQGACAVSYAPFVKAVTAFPVDATLTVFQVERDVAVSARGYEMAYIASLEAEAYPAWNAACTPGATHTAAVVGGTWTYQVEQAQVQRLKVARATLADAVNRVAFAAATDPTRPVFQTIFTQVEGTRLTLAAASSHWIAEYAVPGDINAHAWRFNLLLFAEAMRQAVQFLPEGVVDLEVVVTTEKLVLRNNSAVTDAEQFLNACQARLSCGNVAVSLRPVQGTYPNYRMQFPHEWQTRAVCQVADLRTAIRECVSSRKHADHRLRLSIGEQTITITSLEHDQDTRKRSVSAEVNGAPLSLVLDGRTLLAFLKVVPLEVVMEFRDAQRPGLFSSQGEPGRYAFVQMPERE